MNAALKLDLETLMEDLILIRQASISKTKYDNLLDVFAGVGFVENMERSRKKWRVLNAAMEDYTIEVVMIKPGKGMENTNTYTDPDGPKKPIPIISFQEVREVLRNDPGELAIAFERALKQWDPVEQAMQFAGPDA